MAETQTLRKFGIRTELVENEYGKFWLPVGDHQTEVWKESSHYEKDYVEMMLSHVAPGGVALDVGACFGAHAIPYARKCDLVYAFEPNPVARHILEMNIMLNGLEEKVVVMDFGLAGSDGFMREVGSPPKNMGATCYEVPHVDTSTEKDPACVRLDSIEGLPAAQIMKVDVEVMELEVLRGGIQYLSEHMPTLFIECHPTNRKSLMSLLMYDLGYSTLRRHSKNIFAINRCLSTPHELTRDRAARRGGSGS